MQIYNYNKFLSTLDKQHSNELNKNENKKDFLQLIRDGDVVIQSHLNDYDSTQHSNLKKICPPTPRVSVTPTKIHIDTSINSIADLLSLIQTYKLLDERNKPIEYNINMNALHNIQAPLQCLDNMIGMKNLKQNIVDQILYFIQGFHTDDFMHTVIYGPPGTGKTEIAKLLGEIYSKLGFLKKGTFKKVTRSDLIAGYLGQTALKTRDVIKDSLGGVLFIDEAYSLGNSEKRDSFSKECIDTLCEALSVHKHELLVIIAGYENELNEGFLNQNPGLQSRFTWRFHTDKYSTKDLENIFKKKVNDIRWFLSPDCFKDSSWFQDKMSYFTYFGRDMETLLAKTKVVHSKRVFCKSNDEKRVLTIEDMNKGFQLFLQNEDVKKRPSHSEQLRQLQSIYI